MGICFWGTSNFLFSNVTTTRDNNNIEICLKRIHYITLISLLQLDPLPINQTDSGTAHTKIFCHHLTRMGGSKLSFLLRNKQCLCCSSQCYYVNRGLDVPSSLFLNISSVFLTKKVLLRYLRLIFIPVVQCCACSTKDCGYTHVMIKCIPSL